MIDDEIESGLARIAERSEIETRRFAADCCERLLSFFTEPMMSELLNFARRRARAELDSPELEDLRNRADVVHGALYPGYGDPSAAECAVCAAGEIAFTSSPLKASSNALVFASKAVAKLAAESVGDMEYDAAFERKYGDERRSQLHLLQVRLKQLDL